MKIEHLKQIFIKTKGHCHFCGDVLIFECRGWCGGDLSGFWEIDHVIQRAKGGSNSPDNYLPACTACNRLRWNRKGPHMRELIELGLIAREEIKRKSQIGAFFQSAHKMRKARNHKRRINRASLRVNRTRSEHEQKGRVRE